MNLTLQQAIYSKLTGVTSNVYYQYFPSSFVYATDTGIVYDLPNTDNINSFDSKELGKTFNLQLTVNHQNSDYLLGILPTIKESIYSLERSTVRCVSLVNEEITRIDELKTYSLFIEFEIK